MTASRQEAFFAGSDYAWNGPQGTGKMPLAVFENQAQWHATERENWSREALSPEGPPVHSGTPAAAFARSSSPGTQFHAVVPLNVSDHRSGRRFTDREANRADDGYRQREGLPENEGFVGGKSAKDRPLTSPAHNPLLRGESIRYANQLESPGSSSFVSPRRGGYLTFRDPQVEGGLDPQKTTRGHLTPDEFRASHGVRTPWDAINERLQKRETPKLF